MSLNKLILKSSIHVKDLIPDIYTTQLTVSERIARSQFYKELINFNMFKKPSFALIFTDKSYVDETRVWRTKL